MAQPIDLGDLRSKLKIDFDRVMFRNISDAFRNVERDVENFGIKLHDAISAAATLTAQLRTEINATSNAYLQAAGKGEQAARAWSQATYDVRTAQIAIGRELSQGTIPGLQIQAAIMRDIADLAKNNPALSGGVSGAVSLLGTANQLSQSISSALGGGDTAKAAGGLAGGGLLLTGALVAIEKATEGQTGILGSIHSTLESGLNNVINAIGLIAPNTAAQLHQLVSSGGGSGQLGHPDRNGVNTLENSPAYAQLEQAQIQHDRQTVAIELQYNQQRLDAARDLGRSILEYAIQEGRQKQDMARDQVRQVARENQDFLHNRALENRDFNRQLAIQERDFYRQRERENRDQQISIERDDAAFAYQQQRSQVMFDLDKANQEKQFQIQQRRAAEDHQFRLLDLAANRDALGVFKENRAYNLQKQRDTEDFNNQRYIANQQRALQLKDELYNFNLQRQYRLEDFKRRQADEDQDRKWRIQQEKEDFAYRQQQESEALAYRRGQEAVDAANRLADMNTAAGRFRDDQTRHFEQQRQDAQLQYDRAKTARDLAYGQEIFDLDAHLVMTNKQWTKFYTDTDKELKVFIGDVAATIAGPAAKLAYENSLTNLERSYIGLPPIPGKAKVGGKFAAGGYAPDGFYRVGEAGTEWIMDAAHRQAAEGLLGGYLTQDNVLSALRGGGVGGGSFTLNQNFTFQGSFTEGDRAWFRQAAREEATQSMASAISRVSARRRR